MTDLFSIVYHSRIILKPTEAAMADEVSEILRISRRNNLRDGVTGALWLADGCFVQALEGPQAAVQAAFGRILGDPRHLEVTLLQMNTLDHRVFSEWSMGFVSDSGDLQRSFGDAASAQGFSAEAISSESLLNFFVGLMLRQAGRSWPPPRRRAA